MTFVDDARVRDLLAMAATPEVIAERFELGPLLGEGGMGTVFEAWDRDGERTVALKLLRGVDEATRARFAREADALASLTHAGVVGYVAHGSTAHGELYLAMERLVGVTLAARLAEEPLGVEDAARVAYGVAGALAAAHRLGLVHRDIKPSNIFLVDGAPHQVKLLDFGLARGSQAPTVTRTGALVGTPCYMAPEQVRSAADADARSDLFSLGAVVFECLTGRAPFGGTNTMGVLVNVLVEQPPDVRQLCPSVPAALATLIERLLAKDPGKRPADASEVARELRFILGERDTQSAIEPSDREAGESSAAAERAPASEKANPAQPGALLAGKYRVQRTLGSGGMGIVLLARHETLDRLVAIKLLRTIRSEPSGEGTVRLLREARAASRLESEHVVRVMDVGTLDDGAPFIVMEFLRGKDLGQVLRELERLPVDVAVDYVLQAGEAIAEAHALGIVHRDLKPSNLFLTTRRDGSPLIKVLDFGISKISDSRDVTRGSARGPAPSRDFPADGSITAPGVILGSPVYMSPEQLRRDQRVDARTDIWSLGVLLHELVTGRPPFQGESTLAIVSKIAADAPADFRQACPEAPEGLAAIVRRCLEKDPARRFGSIAELTQALAPYAPERAQSVLPESSANSARAGTAPRGRGVTRGVAVVAGAAVVAATAALLVRERAPTFADSALPAASSALVLPWSSPSSGVAASTSSVSSILTAPSEPRVVPPSASAVLQATSSSAPPPPSVPPRRSMSEQERQRRTAPANTGVRAAAKPTREDALDVLDPALISR